MSDAPRVLVERDGPLATLTLNRPDKLNAIDSPMLDALDDALGMFEAETALRVLIVTGAGRAFSAGADIREWTTLSPEGMRERWVPRGHRTFERLAALPFPVIAALGGIAFGGGLELALASDIRIASHAARFGLPEVTIAAVPGWGGTHRLARLIGVARAKHVVLTGRPIDAATAERWGLVTELVEPEALLPRARGIAEAIAANAPVSLRLAKQLIDSGASGSAALALDAEAAAQAAGTADAAEGRASFLERRPPRFAGR